jgi:hypothetical protein
MSNPTSAASSDPLVFRYRFRLRDGAERRFTVTLDRTTLSLVAPPRSALPDWTRLGHHQCDHCPLKEAGSPRCPAAVSLLEVVELFGSAVSFEPVDVTIDSEARQYAKRTSLQEAVSSLTGLLMVTSGCPIMGRLKPLVRFHLPFATDVETKYRVISMYLLAQLFLAQRGRQPDWTLTHLAALYHDLRKLNQHIAKRLQEAGHGDAHLNAVVILDSFADSLSFSLDQRALEDLEQLFACYLSAPPTADPSS